MIQKKCSVCQREFGLHELTPAQFVRPSIAGLIAKARPDWNSESWICFDDLNHYRSQYIEQVLFDEKGELTSLEQEVIESLKQHDVLTKNLNATVEEQYTLGQRMADLVATFGGSWSFIVIFACVMISWIVMNSVAMPERTFDPYPFILLNLVLSCLAAVQAPIIMMSQNRQESKDRLRAENDYRVNLKAELEIRHLHSKLDLLLTHQWQRLLEIQQVQTDLLQELGKHR